MSYDIDLFYLEADRDPLAQGRDVHVEREGPSPNPEEEARRRLVVEDLLTLHPTLVMWPDERGFAYGCCVSSDDRACDILTVRLRVDRALVSFSYFDDPDRTFPSVQRIIRVFERHGWAAYDAQRDGLIAADDEIGGQVSKFVRGTRDVVVVAIEGSGKVIVAPDLECQQNGPS